MLTKKPTMKIKLFLAILVGLFFPLASWAVDMSSDSYKIQWGNVNLGSGRQTSSNYQLGITLGQTAPGLYTSTGYKVRAGFQYIHSIIPFSFAISSLAIDFGNLTPESPKTATNILTVQAGGAGGYQVLAFENHPLRSQTGRVIADTTCDSNDCDETQAGVWQSTTTFGFGFNMSGDDVPADFTDTTYFRQFANQENSETPQAVMTSNNVTRQSQATVTYKANIAASQAAGNYENAIVYIAIPGY